MQKRLFDQLKESLDQAIEHAKGERDDLRTTVCFDNARFVLSTEQWKAFNEKFAATPRNIPALRKLLTDEGVFDAE